MGSRAATKRHNTSCDQVEGEGATFDFAKDEKEIQ